MANNEKIALEIVTPDRRVVSDAVDEVVLPGSEGYFGVLPGHAPMLTSLGVGEGWYRSGGKKAYLAVAGGFCEVLRDRVSVLAENCERAEEIDSARAEQDRRRWEDALKHDFTSDLEFRRAEVRLKKAIARISVRAKAEE